MTEDSHIRLGVLTRPYGLQGGMRCRLDYPTHPQLALPLSVEIGYSASFTRAVELVRFEPLRKGEALCWFARFETPEELETIADQAMFVPRKEIRYASPFEGPGLIGFDVQDQEGRSLGQIARIDQMRAHPVLTIREGDREWMLPGVEEFIKGIDEENEILVVQLIPGLYADETDEPGPDQKNGTVNGSVDRSDRNGQSM